jgi:membrane protease YdiL (CAAX protease family)
VSVPSPTGAQPNRERTAIAVFFGLAFGIPWLGWTALAITKVQLPSPLAWVFYLSGDFCSVAGFLATYYAGKGPAVRALLRRCVNFRVPIIWWILALGLPIVWEAVTSLCYGALHGGIGTGRVDRIVVLLSPGLLFGFVTGPLREEAGWRGFLLPRLLRRFSPMTSSLILGTIWTAWHYPLYYQSQFASWDPALTFWASVTLSTIAMTIVFLKTDQSVLLAVVMHWSINQAPVVVREMFSQGPGSSPPDYVHWQLLGRFLVTTLLLAAVGFRRSAASSAARPATS